MATNPATQALFQPLPREVIDYWIEGRYAALLALPWPMNNLAGRRWCGGFYRYDVTVEQKTKTKAKTTTLVLQRGYCVVDLYGGNSIPWRASVL